MEDATILGRIVNQIAGVFYVETPSGVYVCTARGKFKHLDTELKVGDNVEFLLGDNCAIIEKLLPRKNYLLRPPVSNVDQLVVVLSSSPKPDFILIDKIIINSIINNIDIVLCVNKSDILSQEFIDFVKENYKNCVDKIIIMSAQFNEGVESLTAVLNGKISCLAGQSAVGKSTITNLLVGEKVLDVGAMSLRSGRGKHTTRHSELFKLKCGGYIADTAGFTFFDGLKDIDPNDLMTYYTDFEPYLHLCKFKSCQHLNEPICGVKDAVSKGLLSVDRYNRYVQIYDELKRKWEQRY